MKVDQIAYYAHNPKQVRYLKALLALENREWVEDQVTGTIQLFDSIGEKLFEGQSKASLLFNYDNGIETEILTYTEGPHWHQHRYSFLKGATFLSHIGIHMAPGEKSHLTTFPLVQKMRTTSHTNPYLLSQGRTYDYEIYDTVNDFGHYTKLIWRIQP